MKVGDIVQRPTKWREWREWRRVNEWRDVSKEVGIILARANSEILEIYWPTAGTCLENERDLEIVNDN